jgi:hypothetical protein
MAHLVAAFGTSHSPTLNSPVEDYRFHAEIDRGKEHWKRGLLDKTGQPCSYNELLAQADPAIATQITDDIISERIERCDAGVSRLKSSISDADLDALVIVGDDQREQFSDDNMPALLIYWGETIRNNLLSLPDDAPSWWKRARSQYHEERVPRDYPVASNLGRHLIEYLMDCEFDVSHATKLKSVHGEGHAFGFFHRRLMSDIELPVVPVLLNTYYPPNQPRPKRCFELGQAIRKAIEAWSTDARIGILASGGLSHFTVDEDLDGRILDACRNNNREALVSTPVNLLNSGNSEIRNWIATAGAADGLKMDWDDYIPCYRSLAGTGCGMAFASWS